MAALRAELFDRLGVVLSVGGGIFADALSARAPLGHLALERELADADLVEPPDLGFVHLFFVEVDTVGAAAVADGDLLTFMIEDALVQNRAAPGFIFDGFPRTIAQAEALDASLAQLGQQIDLVIRLEVDPQLLMDRIAKRYAEEGRADDNPESFKVRLDAYLAQTAPLIVYYERQGKLVGVDGMTGIQSVASAIAAALGA